MVVFLHIPKTAGTSFGNALCQMFPSRPRHILTDDDLERERRTAGDDELVMGHLTMHGIARQLAGAQILTMLRHPVARAISQYQGWHDSPVDPNWQPHLEREKIAAEALEFTRGAHIEEYFASNWTPITRQFTNYQSYILSGRHIDSTPFEVWQPDILREAKENLSRSIRFFGLTERMEESLMLLWATIGGAGLAPGATRLNLSLRRSDQWQIPEVVRRIESRSPMDLELYQWAERELVRRLDASPISLRSSGILSADKVLAEDSRSKRHEFPADYDCGGGTLSPVRSRHRQGVTQPAGRLLCDRL